LGLFGDPFNAGDFRCAIPSQGKKRPAEPTIDIEPTAWRSVMPFDPAVASRREPERRHAGYAPLAPVAMSTEDQIDGVVVLQLIEDVWRMGQQENETVLCARWQTAQVSAMQRGIIDAGNGDFPTSRRNKDGLIDQEGDLVAVGELAVLIDRHATVVVMDAQSDEDWGESSQGGEKSKYMRQPLRYIEEIAGHKNPVGSKFTDGRDDTIMSRLIAVQMQIAEMHGSPACQEAVHIGEPGNVVCGESDFQVRNKTK